MKKPEDKLFENIIDNLGKPKVKPKRVETTSERIERMHHLYDDGPKPKHFDDKSIVDMEKWNSMKGLEKKTPVINKPKAIKQPNPLDNNGPFSMEVKRQIKDGTYGPGNKKDMINQIIDYAPHITACPPGLKKLTASLEMYKRLNLTNYCTFFACAAFIYH